MAKNEKKLGRPAEGRTIKVLVTFRPDEFDALQAGMKGVLDELPDGVAVNRNALVRAAALRGAAE